MPDRCRWQLLALVCLGAAALLSCSYTYRLSEEEWERSSAWPFYRGDVSSTGASPVGRFGGKLDVVWERKRGEKPAGPLTIVNGILVYPGSKNKIRFYSARDGANKGHLKSHGSVQSGVAVLDSLALFGTSPVKSRLRCVDLWSGKKVWTCRIKDVAAGSIIVDDKLLIATVDGSLSAYDAENGDILWTFEAEGGFVAPPSYGHGMIFQPCDDGHLYVVSPADGSRRYRVELGAPLVSAVVAASMVYAADMSGNVYAVDPDSGCVRWTTPVGGPVWGAPALRDNRLFVGHSGGEVVALSASEGDVLWRFDGGQVFRGSATVVGGYVVAGTMGGEVYSLDVTDGMVVDQRRLKGAIAFPPVADGDRVFVATQSGQIVCFGVKGDDNE